MGALWRYRWLVLVLLIAPTIAYCQYRAVEKLASERCASAGGTWDEDESECRGLPPPKAGGARGGEAGAATPSGDAAPDERTDEPTSEATDESANAPADAAYDVQYVPADAAGEAPVGPAPGVADDGPK